MNTCAHTMKSQTDTSGQLVCKTILVDSIHMGQQEVYFSHFA